MPSVELQSTRTDLPPADRKTGWLLVTTTPARAGVYVNDIYFGLTPIEIDLAPGIYTVRIEREGYKSVQQKVSVRGNVMTELPVVFAH